MQRAVVTLESKAKSLEKDREEYSGKRQLYQQRLDTLKERIADIRLKLNEVSSAFQLKKSKDDERRQQLNANESALEGLYAKRERLGQFRSTEDRNASLQRQIDSMRTELAEQEKLCKAVTADSDAIDAELESLSKEMRKLQRATKETERALQSKEEEKESLRREKATLMNDRKKLWKEQHETKKRRESLRPRRDEKEKQFRFTMSLGMWTAYCNLKRIQEDIEENGAASRYCAARKSPCPFWWCF